MMLIQTNKTYETDETDLQTKARLQNELEQDRIAKALEPVAAEHLMQKLPNELEDMIRWWATEPTPTAKIMKGVSVSWRVFPQYWYWSPLGMGTRGSDVKVLVHVKVLGAWQKTPRGTDWWFRTENPRGRRTDRIFAILDVPLDAEATSVFQPH